MPTPRIIDLKSADINTLRELVRLTKWIYEKIVQAPNFTSASKKTYQGLVAKFDEEYAEAFMENERDTYVGGVILREGQAIMTDFKNGHAEVIQNEDVCPEYLEIFEELTKYEYKDE